MYFTNIGLSSMAVSLDKWREVVMKVEHNKSGRDEQ
jgi:hypothetical protein